MGNFNSSEINKDLFNYINESNGFKEEDYIFFHKKKKQYKL